MVPPGYERARVNGHVITWSPAIVQRIAALHESGAVQVTWLTTWCDDAASLIAPALGLPLDCLVVGTDDHRATDNQTWWKSVTAARVSYRRPLIWTDDDLDYAERNGEVDWLRDRDEPTLAIAPDPRRGITPKFMDRIEAFVGRLDGRRVAAGAAADVVAHSPRD